MISIKQENKRLAISGFPENGMSVNEVQEAFEIVKKDFGHSVSSISIDLGNVRHSDYAVFAFLKACGELCLGQNTRIEFTNADEKLTGILTGMGFQPDGIYSPEQVRTVEAQTAIISVGKNFMHLLDDFRKLLDFAYELFLTIIYFIKKPREINYKEMFYYIDQTGANAVPIVTLICFLIGVILAFQGISQMKVFGLQIYVADLVGLAIVRELGPLMVAMICTGRAGSAFAAELGTMKVSEEIDAIKTMGLKPVRVLIIPKILGLMIVMPMLIILGDFIGIIGGGVMTSLVSDISLEAYINRVLQSVIIANVFESIVKGIVFAFLVAAIGCFRGLECENDAKGVGHATTSSVVSGIFLIIIADTAITLIYPSIVHLFGVNY